MEIFSRLRPASLLGHFQSSIRASCPCLATCVGPLYCRLVSMAASLPPPVTDSTDSIVQILRQVEDGTLGLMKAAEQVVEGLRAKGFVYSMSIPPRLVGMDPSNRDGEGCNAQAVLDLAHEIAEVGFIWRETEHAMCIEVVPNDCTVAAFNVTLTKDSGLAPVVPEDIKFGSVSCGHTNFALRCIDAAIPSQDPLLAEHGFMSVRKLETKDQAYAAAVRSGLHWTVMKWQVRCLYPTVPSLLQTARNMSATMIRQESEMQGLLRLHALSAAQQNSGRDIDWSIIKKNIARSRPPYVESLNEMISFLVTRSGGVAGKYLHSLKHFFRVCVHAKRTSLPAQIYGAVADFPFHYVAIAILESAWTCPAAFVRNGRCGWISAAEVLSLGKQGGPRRDLVQRAEKMLIEARELLPKAGIADDDINSNKGIALVAKLDIATARFLLKKQEGSKIQHENLAGIGSWFLTEITAAFPAADTKAFDVAWGLEPGASAGEEKSSLPAEPVLSLYDVNEKGESTHVLANIRAKGFDLGASVVEASSLEASGPCTIAVYRIASVDELARTIRLAPVSGCSGGDVSLEEESFLAKWVISDPKRVTELHPGWPAHRTAGTHFFQSTIAKGRILAAVGAMEEMMNASFSADSFAILTKPSKKVIATTDIGIGRCVLWPESSRCISQKAGTGAGSEAGALVAVDGQLEDEEYFLMPCTQSENVAPYWFVGSTDDASKANLRMSQVSLSALSGMDFVGEQPAPYATAAGKPKRARKKMEDRQSPADETHQGSVTFPVMINHVALKAGDELLVYKQPSTATKRAREPEAILIGKLAKKSKQ
jgi:hypothetical protein